MSQGRAPGKVLLLGEHAVVYGHPALAAAIPRFVTVDVAPATALGVELPGGLATPKEVIEGAIAIAREAGFEGGFLARVESEIPLGSGLGSSAALGVAMARAFRPGCAPDEAARLAMHLERLLHGAPSGVDPAICARGGVIFFARGEPARIEEVRGSAFLCVLLSGIARGTRSTVMPLADRRKTDPAIDSTLRELGDLARDGRRCFEKGDLWGLGAMMQIAHSFLRDGLEVSCPELDAAVEALRSAGALGAKLTGAGGGGAAIGLAHDEAHATAMAAATGGFAVRIGYP